MLKPARLNFELELRPAKEIYQASDWVIVGIHQ